MSMPKLPKGQLKKVIRSRFFPKRKKASQGLAQISRARGEIPYELIRTNRILIPKDVADLDEEIVANIAESIQLFGMLHPVAVRHDTEGIALVAGAHRLEAAKRAGLHKIPCVFVQGNETDAALIRLGENLFRKTLTVLRQAEQLAEYYNLASAKVNVSGQPAQKGKTGRPPGGIALAARELPLVGRSVEARRRIIGNALKIDNITPEAKEAMIKAQLANNQSALLKIAEKVGRRAQLKAIAELTKLSRRLNGSLDRASEPSNARIGAPKTGALKSSGNKVTIPTGGREITTFDDFIAKWNADCRSAWAYLPASERERFLQMARRIKLRARADVVGFLTDVFRGRGRVGKKDLFAFASARGFSKAKIRQALISLGYRTVRIGRGSGAQWFAINIDQEWKGQLSVFRDSQIAAVAEHKSNAEDLTAKPRPRPGDADYFADI
jgi:ParB-like nuclease family protein